MPQKEKITTNDEDRSALGALYPEPKSYESKRADEQKRIEMYVKKLPRFPQLTIPLFGSIVLGLGLFFILNLSTMWQDGNISLVFFSFALWLAVCALAFLWIKKVNATFYAYGKTAAPFWIGFVVIMAVLVTLFVTGWQSGVERVQLASGTAGVAFVLFGLHVTTLFVLMKRRINK